jgi:site-specific recombinase XerD
MRRGLGYKLREAGRALLDFVAFLEQPNASYITQSLALAWAQPPSNTQPAHWAQRLSFARGFARYRSATDPRTQIPSQGLLPFQPKRARPFLYSDDNIRSLLHAALGMECRYERGKLRPWVYYCLFGLLSVSGLRLGEACNLELQDVDLKAAVLTVRCAKFGKDRLVPLHRSTCAVLAKYIAKRRRHWEGRAVSSFLFVSSWGNRLDSGDIHRTFYVLSRQIGLRGTFRMLLTFAQEQLHTPPARLGLQAMDAPLIVDFLDHLEKHRSLSVRSRNLRLTAIHSFFRYAAFEAPAHAAQIQRVLAIPSKRFTRTQVHFLTRAEVKALLVAPDQRTWFGRRDHAFLLVATQTGLRQSEMTSLTRNDVALGPGAHVRVIGKGRKERCVPLAKATVAVLKT